jgi:hypothetical protein
MNRRTQPRGWVMIMVLLVLLVMSILVAGFYAMSFDSAGMSRIIVAQQVAMSHADTGLQDGLRAMRALQLDTSVLTTQCTSAEVDSNACATIISSTLGDNGSGADLSANGGLQYQYFVYRKPTADDPGQPSNRFVVRSVGYYGYLQTANNLVTSVVEAEIDIGSGTNYKCTGGYECQ